jgi:hypothetical protein
VGSHCVYSNIIIEMLLKLYKIGIRCRFFTVTYVISSLYIPRELFMCYVKGDANSGKQNCAEFFTISHGVYSFS